MHDVLAAQLQNAIVLHDLAKLRVDIDAEQSLAGAAAGKEHRFAIASRRRRHDHFDSAVAATDAQVAIVDYDRQRHAGPVAAFALAAQTPNRAKQVQLIEITLFGRQKPPRD